MYVINPMLCGDDILYVVNHAMMMLCMLKVLLVTSLGLSSHVIYCYVYHPISYASDVMIISQVTPCLP